MNEIEKLSQTSIDLADKIANHSFWVVFTAVCMVVIFIILGFFIWQLRLFTIKLVENMNKLDLICKFAEKVMQYFEKDAFRIVDIDQARSLISTELEKSKNAILVFVAKTKQKNNLDDKKAVEERVSLFIEKTYGLNVSLLRKFDFHGRPLSYFLDEKWKEEVKCRILKDCEDNTMDCSRIEATYSALFDSFKMIINHKIDDIS